MPPALLRRLKNRILSYKANLKQSILFSLSDTELKRTTEGHKKILNNMKVKNALQ